MGPPALLPLSALLGPSGPTQDQVQDWDLGGLPPPETGRWSSDGTEVSQPNRARDHRTTGLEGTMGVMLSDPLPRSGLFSPGLTIKPLLPSPGV